MVWQEKILSRLTSSDNSSTIVLDKTGVLFTTDFTKRLDEIGQPFAIIHKPKKILSNKSVLVITSIEQQPSFIEQKYNIIRFDYSLLPLDADNIALRSLSPLEIIELLNYSDRESLPYITMENFSNLLHIAVTANLSDKANKLSGEIKQQVVQDSFTPQNITYIADLWAKRLYYGFIGNTMPDLNESEEVDKLTNCFWKSDEFKNTHYYPIDNLFSVDKICQYINSKELDKFALICFDGMGLAEWLILKEELPFKFNEKHIFSLIPSITCFSRKAAFGGSYEDVFHGTSQDDSKLFASFFKNRSTQFFREKDDITEDSLLGIDAVGMIFNFFDDIGHNTVLPAGTSDKSLYFKNVREYIKQSSVIDTIKKLKDNYFNLFFCSDHGCALCVGNGQRIEKYLVDKFSKRATIGADTQLLDNPNICKIEIPFVSDKYAYLAKDRECFLTAGERIITHGGLSLEEMVVPFVEVID